MWFQNFWNWITHIFTIYRLYKVQNSSCFILTIFIPLFTMRLVFSKDKTKTKGIIFTMPACSLKVFRFKNWCYQKMSKTKNVPLNWYYLIKKNNEKDLDDFWHRKLTLKARNLALFDTSPLHKFSKFNNLISF